MTTPPGELMYMKMGLSTDCASRYNSCVRGAQRGTGERRGEWCGAEAGPSQGAVSTCATTTVDMSSCTCGEATGGSRCHRSRGGGASRRGLTGPLTQMIRSCSSREKMSKARSPRAVVSSTIGIRLLRGASWEGGWKLGEWKLRLSAEAAVARPSRSIGLLRAPNMMMIASARAVLDGVATTRMWKK